MRNKFLTRLLAVVMSVGLVLQPVVAFAETPADGELSEDPVVEEVVEAETVADEFKAVDESVIALDAGVAQPTDVHDFPMDEPIVEPEPEPLPEPEPAVELPELQNVYLDGDLLYFDEFEGASTYEIKAARYNTWVTGSPANLNNIFKGWIDVYGLEYGPYTVGLTALNDRTEALSKTYELVYTVEDPANSNKLQSAVLSTNCADIAKYGNEVVVPTLEIADHPELSITKKGWEKFVPEFHAWEPVKDGYFEEGTYRYNIEIAINPSYKDDYEFLDDFFLWIDGQKCFPTLVWPDTNTGAAIGFGFSIPEIEITEPEPIKKTVISELWINSNYTSIPKYDSKVEQPTFAFPGEEPIEIVEGNWYKEEEDGSWGKCTDGVFTPGKYHYELDFRIDDKHESDYELSPTLDVIVNGYTWKRIYAIEGMGSSLNAEYISQEFEITDPSDITLITRVDATSDIDSFMTYGEQLKVPAFTPANPDLINFSGIYWQKKVGDEWQTIGNSGTIEEGSYRFAAYISIKGNNYKTQRFDENVKVFVDGKEWSLKETGIMVDGYPVQMLFTSPEYVVSGDTPVITGHWEVKWKCVYFIGPDGKPVTGVQEIGGKKYLFSKNGTLLPNTFYTEGGKTYYFGEDGSMVYGWLSKWSHEYYFDKDGVMQTGFVDIDGDTYYFKADGRLVCSKWITYEGNKYYSKADGSLAKSETILKWGKKYTFNAEGMLIATK